jgi:Txe/YoeB family toxin of Txe-Axe toxin-antitoxin module
MARNQPFLNAVWTDQFKERYAKRQANEQKAADKVAMALMKGDVTPGMRITPIEPEKYYDEARINDGDRLAYRIAAGTVYFIDIVPHDRINKYGKR